MRDELKFGIGLGHVDAANVKVVVAKRPLLGIRRRGAGGIRGRADRHRAQRADRTEEFSSIHVSDSEREV